MTYLIKSPNWVKNNYTPKNHSLHANMGFGFRLHVSQDWSIPSNGLRWHYKCDFERESKSNDYVDHEETIFEGKDCESDQDALIKAEQAWVQFVRENWLIENENE